MKTAVVTKIALLLILSLWICDLSAQVPQGINFQAVARNSNGDILADVQATLRIGIIAYTGSIKVWEETHSVTTSDIGLFKVIVGKGVRTAGTVDKFSAINWGSDRYSLKVELKTGTAYEDMGTSELQSVPYALVAGTVTSLSAISSLDVRETESHNTDSTLFSVKNKDGNIVFAVYNEGVRINVADYPQEGKAAKGGFAIGGFDKAKGETNEYMRVSPDSVRIYVDEATSKGAKGGFAIGGFDPSKGVTDFLHLSPENYFIGHLSGSSITTGKYNSFFGYDAGINNAEGNNNVFIGNETGYSNTDGHWNIFIGNTAGYSNTSGDANIILGDEAGYSNTTGSWNVFMGDLAGHDNTTGESNVYIGADAGLKNTIGNYNVFMGSTAGYSNTEGTSNVFLGESSGYSNTLGNSNVFIGTESGAMNDTGNSNVFIGDVAGWANTTGADNVFIGASAGEENETGSFNVFLGEYSGNSNTYGISNVFLGKEAGQANTLGSWNVFLGTLTGVDNTIGQQNVFLGQEAGTANTTGSYNVSIGTLSGSSNITGNQNVFIGYQAGLDETGSNRLYIDNEGRTKDEALIYGEFDNNYLNFYANVEMAGDLYCNFLYETSDKKFKTNILDISNVLDKVMAIRPVTYNWNRTDYPKGRFPEGEQIGLIAQELETIFPELVQSNKKGDKAINYTKLSVLLVEAVKEQQSLIEELKKENQLQEENIQQLNRKINSIIESGNK